MFFSGVGILHAAYGGPEPARQYRRRGDKPWGPITAVGL